MATSLVLVSVLFFGTFQGISCGALLEETKKLPAEVLDHLQPVAYPMSNKGHDVITGTGPKLHHVTDIHVIPAASKSGITPKLKDKVKIQKVLKPKRKPYSRKRPIRKRPQRKRSLLIGKRLLQQGKYLRKAIKNVLKSKGKLNKAIDKKASKKQRKLNKAISKKSLKKQRKLNKAKKGIPKLLKKKFKPKKSKKQLRLLKPNAKKGKKPIGKRINIYRRRWRKGRRYPNRRRRINLRKGKTMGKWRKGARGRPKFTLRKRARNLKPGLRSFRTSKGINKMRNALKSILSSMEKDKKMKRKSSLTSNYIRSVLGVLPNSVKGKIGRMKRNDPVNEKKMDKIIKSVVKPNKPKRKPSLTANYIRSVLGGGSPKRTQDKTANKIAKSVEKKEPRYERLQPKDIKDKIKRILARRNKAKKKKVPVITEKKNTATVLEETKTV